MFVCKDFRFSKALTVLAFVALIAPSPRSAVASSLNDIEPNDTQSLIAQLSTYFLSQRHYANRKFEDSLSETIFQNYIQSLDPSKIYFTQEDINDWNADRQAIDDYLAEGKLDFAFKVYRVFQKRAEDRLSFALDQLKEKPDFSVSERFDIDRSAMSWAKNDEVLDEYWRKAVKFDALSLMISGHTWEESQAILKDRYLRLFSGVIEVNADDVFEIFMNAFTHSIDPHTEYFGDMNDEEFNAYGEAGIGLALRKVAGYPEVVRVIPGGPSDLSGRIKAGDRIVAIGDDEGEFRDAVGHSLEEIVRMLRGPEGSEVALRVLSKGLQTEGAGQIVRIERIAADSDWQAPTLDFAETGTEEDATRIGIIDIPMFYTEYNENLDHGDEFRSTSRDVKELLKKLNPDVDGLVIDLRYNGGGTLREAVELTSLFVNEAVVLPVKSSNGDIQVVESINTDVAWNGPLIVLVNGLSAGSSEIFAAGIQDYARGLVVGTPTYGLGSIQNFVNMNRFMKSNDVQLGTIKLTTGTYYRVSGAGIQKKGVHPDVMLVPREHIRANGESDEPSALPWESIEPVRKSMHNDMKPVALRLNELHAERKSADQGYHRYVEILASISGPHAASSVSLSMEDRRSELEDQQPIFEFIRNEADEMLLQHTIGIMTDYVKDESVHQQQ